jgi:uncharacterized membrane protein SirB2
MIYATALVIHVVAAVLGVGQVVGLAIASGVAKPDAALLKTLAQTARWSLALMLLSGIAMMAITQGAYGHAGWLQASVAGFLVIGFLMGQVFRALKAQSYGRVRTLAFATTVLVAVVVALMEAKPTFF